MTRLLVTLGIALAVAAVAAQAAVAGPPVVIGPGGVPQAGDGAATGTITASGSCTAGYEYAGYYREAIPGDNQAASVNVTWNSGTVQAYPSHVAGWIGVQNDAATLWVQAGIAKDASNGLRLYIEYNTGGGATFISEGAASAGTKYSASVTKLSPGVWTAAVGGHSLGYNISLSGMQNTQYNGESYLASDGTCNAMNITFSGSYPYGTSIMTEVQMLPYTVGSITSNGWTSHGS